MMKNNETYQLPPHFQALQSCLRELNARLRSTRSLREIRRYREDFSAGVVSRHLDDLQQHLTKLDNVLNQSLGRLFEQTQSHYQVDKALLKFKGVVWEFANEVDNFAVARVADKYVVGWQLLLEVYLHSLSEVHEWVIKLSDFLQDPVAYAQARGLPTEGRVNVTMVLTFSNAPQLPALQRWMHENFGSAFFAAPQPAPAKKSGMSTFEALAIGALLGFWLGD